MVKVAKLNSRNRITPPKDNGEPLKLDLCCGPNKRQGFKGADMTQFQGVDFVVDLNGAWPWKDNSIEEAHCSHGLEHFNAIQRVHFLNELWRVMKVGAKCTLISPHWSSCRAYGDPTHQWPPLSEFAFFYWKQDWRMANAPHTDITRWEHGFRCNFEVTWGYVLSPEVASRNQEYQQHAMTHFKEACLDVIATLTKV